jgi:hypothetical protein
MAVHQPRAILKWIGDNHVGMRFENIPYPLFIRLLKRMRFDFPLAQCRQLGDDVWWVFAGSQYGDLTAFTARNGLEAETLV